MLLLLCCVCIWCLPNKKTNKLAHKQQQQQQQQLLLQKKNNNSALSHRRRPWGWVWWRRCVCACSKVVGSHARSSCVLWETYCCAAYVGAWVPLFAWLLLRSHGTVQICYYSQQFRCFYTFCLVLEHRIPQQDPSPLKPNTPNSRPRHLFFSQWDVSPHIGC